MGRKNSPDIAARLHAYNCGRVIRGFRQHSGLRPEELAERAGLSRSAINQIESGKLTPSLQTLAAIAHVLNVDLAALFSAGVSGVTRISAADRLTLPISSESNMNFCQFEILFHERAPESFDTYLAHFSVGMHLGPHQHDGMEYILVLDGSLRHSRNGKDYLLGRRDTAHFDGTQQHSYEAEEPATVLVIVSKDGQ